MPMIESILSLHYWLRPIASAIDLSEGILPLISITIVPLVMSFYELSRNGPADLVGIFTQSINHKGKQRKGKMERVGRAVTVVY
jgi:hypothetical protein